MMKVLLWLNLGYFTYHMVVLKYYKQPKLEMFGTNMTYFTYSMKLFNFYFFLKTVSFTLICKDLHAPSCQ